MKTEKSISPNVYGPFVSIIHLMTPEGEMKKNSFTPLRKQHGICYNTNISTEKGFRTVCPGLGKNRAQRKLSWTRQGQ